MSDLSFGFEVSSEETMAGLPVGEYLCEVIGATKERDQKDRDVLTFEYMVLGGEHAGAKIKDSLFLSGISEKGLQFLRNVKLPGMLFAAGYPKGTKAAGAEQLLRRQMVVVRGEEKYMKDGEEKTTVKVKAYKRPGESSSAPGAPSAVAGGNSSPAGGGKMPWETAAA